MERIHAGRVGFALIVALLVVLASVASACGGGSGNSDGGSSQAPSVTATATNEDTAAPSPSEEPVTSPTTEPMDGPAANPTSIEVEARDSVFDVQPAQGVPGTIEAPANSEFTVRLVNEGVLPHNIAFLTKQGGSPLADGANGDIIMEGESDSITFTTPAAGTYFFQCTVHPQEMIGEFVVK